MKRGIYYALIASIISGIAIFYAKISVAKIDPLILTTGRNLWAGLLFLGILLTGKGIGEIKKLGKLDITKLLIISLIGGVIPFYLFFSGLALTSSINANFIHKTLFIWVAILGTMFLNEKLSLVYVLSFLFILLANLFIAPQKFVFGKGEILILVATLLWSAENVIAKRILKHTSGELLGLFRMLVGGAVLLIIVYMSHKSNLLLSSYLKNFQVIIIGGTILFFYVFTWLKALKHAPATLVTMLLTFSVVVGNILNGAFAGVKIVGNDIYSLILICFATFLLLTKVNLLSKSKV